MRDLNRVADPNRLLVGQVLQIPARSSPQVTTAPRRGGDGRSLVPANTYLFVLADEINPIRGKVIRRVLINPRLTAAMSAQLGKPIPVFPDPERFGFSAANPNTKLPLGRHALGMKPSPFLSASRRQPLGARRFSGTPFWIDVSKARAAGASFHETGEILADLERIRGKVKDPQGKTRLEAIMKLVRADQEVLVRGKVPASAIKGPAAMGATRVLQGVQVIGFTLTAIDMTNAAHRSHAIGSARPMVAETVRQVGGWSSAWAGMKLGGVAGVAVGIETGPGAIATGAIGALVGGFAGYYGFDWIADHIDEN